MPIEVLMPALSPTMTEGTLAKWVKNEGDKVEPGDVIAEIETDKATMEVESVDEGVLGKILVAEGSEEVPVNQLIALLLEDGEDKSALDGYEASSPAPAAEKKEEGPKEEAPAEEAKEQEKAEDAAPALAPAPAAAASAPQVGDRVKASPLAKRIASEKGIDIAQVVGTGPKGRIVRDDVEGFTPGSGGGSTASYGRAAQEHNEVKLNGMRKAIAKRLLESKQTIPHFYLTIDCDVSAIAGMRAELNDLADKDAEGKPSYKLTVNDFVVKAVAMAMKKVPEANASWNGDSILQYNNVDVSIAVAIDGGLITPIVKNADQKTLSEISNEVKSLAAKARDGKLAPEEYQGGGFSISNLGMFGIKEFSAIINPPQSCILAVGTSSKQFVPDESGNPVVKEIMSVTLSSDHRVVDGAVGAEFLKHFKAYIQQPMAMFV